MIETAANQYEVVIQAAIGPVKARFKGKLMLSDLQPPKSYKINFEGQGGAAGYGKGEATVTLEEMGDHETQLHYTATASVGGKIAQIGQRLVDMAAQKMAAEFFAKLNAELEKNFQPEPNPHTAVSETVPNKSAQKVGLWQTIIIWGRRLIGR